MRNGLFLSACLPPEVHALAIQRELARGQVLCIKGDRVERLFSVESGRLKMFSRTSEGCAVPLYTVRSGECIAESFLFSENYPGDVIAETRSRVVGFPKSAVLDAFFDYPEVAAHFMAGLTHRFYLLQTRFELRNLPSAKLRVLEYLRHSAPAGTGQVVIDRPLKSMAEDLGLAHETFYRALAELERDGQITRTKTAIALRLSARSQGGPKRNQ